MKHERMESTNPACRNKLKQVMGDKYPKSPKESTRPFESFLDQLLVGDPDEGHQTYLNSQVELGVVADYQTLDECDVARVDESIMTVEDVAMQTSHEPSRESHLCRCKRQRDTQGETLESCRCPKTSSVKVQTSILATKDMRIQTDKLSCLLKLGFGGEVIVTSKEVETARKAVKTTNKHCCAGCR